MSGPRVLVCDDEPHILRALKVVLREAGFEVETAETAAEALDSASVRPPDAAILLSLGLLAAWGWWTARRERLRIALLADVTRPALGTRAQRRAARSLACRRLTRALRQSAAARHRMARA